MFRDFLGIVAGSPDTLRQMNFRKIINERLKLDRVTIYRLSRRLRGRVSERTLYDYLNGKTDTSTESLAAILEVMDFQIRSGSRTWYADLLAWEKRLPGEKHWNQWRRRPRA